MVFLVGYPSAMCTAAVDTANMSLMWLSRLIGSVCEHISIVLIDLDLFIMSGVYSTPYSFVDWFTLI